MKSGNNSGAYLRKLRIEKGWTLTDVARSLGVTAATVSRVERGLQAPPEALLQAWKRLLEGKPLVARLPRRRRPRGAVNVLAELFLADVKAGLNWTSAGWREPTDVGLAPEDLEAMSEEIERDSLGRVRVSPSASLEPVEEATRILKHRQTVEAEAKILDPVLQDRIPLLWRALQEEAPRGAVVLSGLTRMVRTTAPLILDSCAALVSSNPASLLSGPAGAALLVANAVGIVIPDSPSDVLTIARLRELIEPDESGDVVREARKVADELRLASVAQRLGKDAIIALGTAWAYSSLINACNAAVLTEAGQQHIAEAFWQGTGFSRNDIVTAWSNLTNTETDDERERVGALLWAWPEVL